MMKKFLIRRKKAVLKFVSLATNCQVYRYIKVINFYGEA